MFDDQSVECPFATDACVMCKESKVEMVKEIYKQLLLSLQFGGISTMNIHSRCSQLKIRKNKKITRAETLVIL